MHWSHLINITTIVLIALLGVHTLLKFAFFFVLTYARRRAALDRAYGEKPTATRTSDAAMLVLTMVVAVLLFYRGVDPIGFLGAWWIGATLVQLYFHRFHAPLSPDRAPPPVASPIKVMSYAIQDAPARPWREMVLMAVLIIWSLILIASKYL